MRYEGTIYRPPSEAQSILIQCTIGCPHNRCTFCPMYKDMRFRIRSVAEIKEDLETARKYYGAMADTMFFPDGNTILMKTEQFVEVLRFARRVFPQLRRITIYGSAQYINLKSAEELTRLREAGLSRIHSGMESGDDLVLERIQKGATAREMIEAGRKVMTAQIELSEYMMIGIGGRERSREHALASAAVLNQINPDFIRVRTFVPVPGTPLYNDYRQGKFGLLQPYEVLKETEMLISNLTCESRFYSDHNSNYAWINGKLPEEKPVMLEAVAAELLQITEKRSMPPTTWSEPE
jgi:radical SAM superfamily enzyme YgiQ (UPF0313 family)